MTNMTALDLVREASVRLGIVAPKTLFPDMSDASKFDTDAQLLLGALKQSVRNSVAIAPFQQLITFWQTQDMVGAGGSFTLPMPEGFDGLVSDVLARATKAAWHLELITYSDYIFDSNPGFVVHGDIMEVVHLPEQRSIFSYFYKTKYSYADSEVPNSDNDVNLLPDELLILGIVLYYKNYRGLDFQLEMKNYTEYVTHMRTTGFDPTIAAPSLYKDVGAMNLIQQNRQQGQQQQQQGE